MPSPYPLAEQAPIKKFQQEMRSGFSGDIKNVLLIKAGILSEKTRNEIADAVTARVCRRIEDMFSIGDDEG